eukprot:NODE_324_length_10963_cov_0.175350.p7 type:complete len:122 gc:universal NODE_324_length_10963_cov_0.175350:1582-1947(+)
MVINSSSGTSTTTLFSKVEVQYSYTRAGTSGTIGPLIETGLSGTMNVHPSKSTILLCLRSASKCLSSSQSKGRKFKEKLSFSAWSIFPIEKSLYLSSNAFRTSVSFLKILIAAFLSLYSHK